MKKNIERIEAYSNGRERWGGVSDLGDGFGSEFRLFQSQSWGEGRALCLSSRPSLKILNFLILIVTQKIIIN